MKLKKKLEKKGYEFQSETDTEVIAHLWMIITKAIRWRRLQRSCIEWKALMHLEFCSKIIRENFTAVRKDSPLIVGRTDGGNIIASDVPAVLKYTRDVVFIEKEIVR